MNVAESIHVAWRSVRANKLRSILTMLGVIIGVGAVVALTGIGQGASEQITSQITSTGTNLLTIIPGSFNQGGGVRSAAGSGATLTVEDAQALADPANCNSCAGVAPVLNRNAGVVYDSQNTNTNIFGVTPTYADVRNLPLQSGEWFTESDVNAAVNVAVLGSSAADTLFQGEDPIGKTIRVNRLAFRVVGVAAPKGGAGFQNPDDAIYVPITVTQRKLFGNRQAAGVSGHSVSTIYVQVADKDQMQQAQDDITNTLRERHRLTTADNDFTVINQTDLLNTLNGVIGTLTLFLGAIAGISLLVGGIGIMNIMLVSVTERTREIGIRKAVGARQGDILRQFLVEAITLSVSGGLIGLALGILAAQVMSISGLIRSSVTPQAGLLAVVFSVAVGLFFGIYPARRAARLDPIEALRVE